MLRNELFYTWTPDLQGVFGLIDCVDFHIAALQNDLSL